MIRIFIIPIFLIQLVHGAKLFESESFVLHLEDEHNYTFYPKEQSLKFNFGLTIKNLDFYVVG